MEEGRKKRVNLGGIVGGVSCENMKKSLLGHECGALIRKLVKNT